MDNINTSTEYNIDKESDILSTIDMDKNKMVSSLDEDESDDMDSSEITESSDSLISPLTSETDNYLFEMPINTNEFYLVDYDEIQHNRDQFNFNYPLLIRWIEQNCREQLLIDEKASKYLDKIIETYNILQRQFVDVYEYCRKALIEQGYGNASLNGELIFIRLTRDMFPFDKFDKFYNFLCKTKNRMVRYVEHIEELFNALRKYMNQRDIYLFDKDYKRVRSGEILLVPF